MLPRMRLTVRDLAAVADQLDHDVVVGVDVSPERSPDRNLDVELLGDLPAERLPVDLVIFDLPTRKLPQSSAARGR